MNRTPKVSICIPAYNKARYLPATIESALAQTCEDIEVIISDNASTDGTPEVCRSYSDPRLRYVRFDTVGQTENVNYCLSLARGEYQTLLCDDDVLKPSFVARATAVLDRNPDVGLVYCAFQAIDGSDRPLRPVRSIHPADCMETGEAFLCRLITDGCIVNIAGVMVRRALYQQIGGFSGGAVWGIDWNLWMRMAMLSGAAYLAEPLALYREHGDNLTAAVWKSARNVQDEVRMLDDIFSRIDGSRTGLHALRPLAVRNIARRTWVIADALCILGEGRAARAQLREAVRIDATRLLDVRFPLLWAATYLGHWLVGLFRSVKRWFRPIHPDDSEVQ